jgi:predicted metalloprotease with PDZ domain
MSDELWFAEGFTNYYGPLVETRAGLLTFGEFVDELSGTLNFVLNSPGRELFDVIDMSRQAAFADGANSIDPVNRGNTYISYYPFGEALAMGIDLEIRAKFPGKSLDDWMRAMWRTHADVDTPYTIADLQKTLADATGSTEFAADIFERYIRGQESMEYESLLARAGLLMRKTESGKIWLDSQGLNFSKQGAEITAATRRGSPLYNAGLDRGDRLLKVDGKELKSAEDVEKFINSHKPGDVTECTVTGRTGQREVQVTWTESPSVEVVPFEKSGMALTPEVKAFRKAWLQSRAISPLPKVD